MRGPGASDVGRRLGWATRVARLALVVGAAAVVGATIAGFGSGWVWPLDLVASFRVQLLAAGVVLLALAVVVERRAALIVPLALSVVVNALLIVPLYRGRPDVSPDAPVVTIAHVNMQGGRGDAGAFVEALAARTADVFVVLEPDSTWLAPVLARPSGYRLVNGPSPSSAWVVTRLPVRDVVHPLDPDLPEASIAFTVDAPGGAIRVLGLHTRSPVTPAENRRRDQALDAVARWRAQQAGAVVVVGDLNATPWSAAFRSLLDDTGLQSSQTGFGIDASFPARLWPVAIPIDHSLHTPDLVVADRHLGPTFGSSHRSLFVTYAPAS